MLATSHPHAGSLGRVARRRGADELDVGSTSYLVCWESGGESWSERSSLHELRLCAPPPSSTSRFRRVLARVAGW